MRPLVLGDVRLIGASRTDAGVHAFGQVASILTPEPLEPTVVMAALNARLPRDIRVRAARAAPEGFDARRDARLKRYGYLLATERVASPFLRGFAWHVGRALDTTAMATRGGASRGKHDFAAVLRGAGPRAGSRLLGAERPGRRATRSRRHSDLSRRLPSPHGTERRRDARRGGTRPAASVVGRRCPGGQGPPRRGPHGSPHGLYLLRVRYPWILFPGGRSGGLTEAQQTV